MFRCTEALYEFPKWVLWAGHLATMNLIIQKRQEKLDVNNIIIFVIIEQIVIRFFKY